MRWGYTESPEVFLPLYAELLGHSNFARLLQKTLDEEKATGEKLTQLARSINAEAEKAA